VLIDIYSRFNPSWIISAVEDSSLAADFIAEAIDRNPPCQAVVRHPGAPGSTVEGGDRRQFREQQQSGSSRTR
jgi:hypothetical protein